MGSVKHQNLSARAGAPALSEVVPKSGVSHGLPERQHAATVSNREGPQ